MKRLTSGHGPRVGVGIDGPRLMRTWLPQMVRTPGCQPASSPAYLTLWCIITSSVLASTLVKLLVSFSYCEYQLLRRIMSRAVLLIGIHSPAPFLVQNFSRAGSK